MNALTATEAATIRCQLLEWEERHLDWRERRTLNLNAAAGAISPTVRAVLSGGLAEKGISGGVGHRHHVGGEYIDAIEAAIDAFGARLFSAAAVDARTTSGSMANAVALASLLPRGRAVAAMGEEALGHHSSRAIGWSGLLASAVAPIRATRDGLGVDLDSLAGVVEAVDPAVVFIGSQAMLFPIDVAGVRDVVGPDRRIVYDAAHPIGLIAAGRFQDPLREGADLISASTQKTLFGPIGGIIISATSDDGETVNQTGNRLFSNYQNNRVLAVGHALLEIAVFGEAFADVCIANARALAAALAAGGLVAECEDRGFTASNQFLVPLGSHEDADYYVSRCAAADVMASVTRMPDAGNVAPCFGVRVGLQELTRKGYLPQEMGEVAECFLGVLQGRDPAEVRRRVADLVTGHSTTYYAFESGLPPG